MLTIDPQIQALCPPLSDEELAQLEASLLEEGCRDPLAVWLAPDSDDYYKECHAQRALSYDSGRWICDVCGFGVAPETLVLIDGHHRYDICQRHGLAFDIYQVDCETREEVVNWVINTQLGRRNLSEEQKSYLRGKRYNLEKRHEGRPEGKLPQSEGETAERLGAEYGVGHATIERDGEFAEALDTLATEVSPALRDDVR